MGIVCYEDRKKFYSSKKNKNNNEQMSSKEEREIEIEKEKEKEKEKEEKEKKDKKEKEDEIEEKFEKGSNSCVMDLSIDEGGEEKENQDKDDKEDKEEGNTNILNKSFDKFTQNLNLKDNFENILDFDENIFNDENKMRSKTFAIKNTNITSSQIK